MPPAEFKRWVQRLQYGKRFASEHGIHGTGSKASTMRSLIGMYRGDQWDGSWRGLDQDELLVVNKIFPFANQQQASIVSRNPRTLYTARKEEHELNAPAVQELHDYDIREQNHKRQFQAAFRVHQFAPFGCVRHGYTPSEEIFNEKRHRIAFYRNQHPNRPWLRNVKPWDVLFDPRVEDLSMDGGMQWVAFRDVISRHDIRENPKMVKRDQVDQVAGNLSPELKENLDDALLEANDPDAQDLVEVWSVYEIRERSWFQMTLEGVDDYLRKPADWPIPWEWLPVNFFAVNEQMDTPLSIALMEQMAPLQREYNQVRTMIHQGVLRSRRQNFYNKLKFGDDEAVTQAALAEMSEWIGVDGDPKDAVYPGQTGGLPAGVLEHLGIVEAEQREVLAQSKMSRGERINVESGSEAQFVQAGQEEAEARIEDSFTSFVRDSEALYMQGRRYIMAKVGTAADEVVRIVGIKDGARVAQYATVDAKVLHGEYDFEIETGSMRPRNRDVEAQQAAVDLDIALKTAEHGSNVQFVLQQYWQKRGIDPAQAMKPEAMQAAKQQEQMAAMGAGTEPASLDPNMLSLIAAGGRRR